MIVVAILGLLVAIAIPSTVRARSNSQKNMCISNLREIQAATQIWAIETKQSPSAVVRYDDIRDYMKRAVTCPAGSSSATFTVATEAVEAAGTVVIYATANGYTRGRELTVNP